MFSNSAPDTKNRKRPGDKHLHNLAKSTDVEALKEYLYELAEQGKGILNSQLNHKGGDAGCTPLHYAVQYGRLNNVLALLEAGANVNAIATSGRSPLHYAVHLQKLDEDNKLLEPGAPDKDSNSYVSKLPIVQVLLDHGALVNVQYQNPVAPPFGNTPLIEAIVNEGTLPKILDTCPNEDVVKLLLESGADVNTVNSHNLRAINYVRAPSPILKMLLDHGARWELADLNDHKNRNFYLKDDNRKQNFILNYIMSKNITRGFRLFPTDLQQKVRQVCLLQLRKNDTDFAKFPLELLDYFLKVFTESVLEGLIVKGESDSNWYENFKKMR